MTKGNGKSVDWQKVKEWDERYYLNLMATKKEYKHTPVERTEGDYLVLPDGTRLLDFFNQLYCVNSGQCNAKIQEAIREATHRYGFVWEGYATDYRSKAAKLIVEDILGPYDWAGKVSFASTGSEAVERALIIAKLFKNRPNIITRESAYHGWTMGAAGATRVVGIRSILAKEESNEYRQVPGHPVAGFHVAPAPYCYKCSLGHTYPECKLSDGKLPCVQATESLIKTIGEHTVAAMITEPSFGAGSFTPPKEYLGQIRQMCTDLDIVWICDEIMTGFGRMGHWFGHQAYDVKPDIMTIAKGIVSSALPASGVVVNKEIAEFMDEWRWYTVATFSAHPLAMAAVCANLEYMIEVDIPKIAKEAGDYFGSKLRDLEKKHKCVGHVSGDGMLWLVELVKNKETKERFVPEDRHTHFTGDLSIYPSKFILSKTVEKGVLLGGFVPNTLRIGASLNVSRENMDKAIDAMDYACSALDEHCTA